MKPTYKITYRDADGVELTLSYRRDGDVEWTGDDRLLADQLNNQDLSVIAGKYWPHPWFMCKAVADMLGGTVDAPRPKIESRPGRIYSSE